MSRCTPRFYVACLAAYNNGHLHGTWIDLSVSTSAEEVHEEIARMLSRSPIPNAEEWAIHDFELCSIEIDEHESIEKVCEIAQTLINADAEEEVIEAAIEGFGAEWPQAIERYHGAYENDGDYAYQFAEDCGDLPDPKWAPYVDWAHVERDYTLNGEITIVRHGFKNHVFGSY